MAVSMFYSSQCQPIVSPSGVIFLHPELHYESFHDGFLVIEAGLSKSARSQLKVFHAINGTFISMYSEQKSQNSEIQSLNYSS